MPRWDANSWLFFSTFFYEVFVAQFRLEFLTEYQPKALGSPNTHLGIILALLNSLPEMHLQYLLEHALDYMKVLSQSSPKPVL